MNQLEIRGYIGAMTQQIHRRTGVLCMVLILFLPATGGDRLPLALAVEPLAGANHDLARIQPGLDIALILHAPKHDHIAVHNARRTRLRFLIIQSQIGNRADFLPPAHLHPVLLHR